MYYSVEKFADGGCVVFAHCTFGVVPIISFPTQAALDDFIQMLQGCQEKPFYKAQDKTEVPEEFKKAFKDDPPGEALK